MDLGIIGAVALIVIWAVATFRFEAPGWVHLLLSAGVFLLSINFRLGAASLAPAFVLLLFTRAASAWIRRKNAESLVVGRSALQ
jgi:hypothetical protein